MSSFFSRIQSHFKADTTGRFIAAILQEIINEEPEVLKHLFRNGGYLAKMVKEKKWKPKLEWPFDGGNKKRRADLAIVSVDNEREFFALLEVKAEDKESQGQFRDYEDCVSP